MIQKWLGFCLLIVQGVSASPSSLFWTVCTTDVYDTGEGHLDEDNAFTVFNRRGHGSVLPPDTGFTLGLFTWQDIKAEAGIDYLGGCDDPLYFNGKIGVEENKLSAWAPSASLGIFNIGTHSGGRFCERTNQNIVAGVLGKSLPEPIGGTFYAGLFSGSHSMGKNRQGFMLGYNKTFCHLTDCSGKEYDRWELLIDYASGHNTIGGAGIGFLYRFCPDISFLTGPVFFNTVRYNKQWKWSIQIDITFQVFKIE